MNRETIIKIFSDRKAGAEKDFRFFSVLVPLVQRQDGLHLLYEVRASDLDRQPGEICFPGGHMEDGESPQQCAVRETEEETGIPAGCIEIVSQLDTIYTHSSFLIYCFLGIMDETALERADINGDEVAELFTVPLDSILKQPPEVYINRIIPAPAEDFPYDRVTGGEGYSWREGNEEVPVYDIDGHVIWGLTGRITKRLAEVINSSTDIA